MKFKNRKFSMISALVSISAVAALSTVAVSCAKQQANIDRNFTNNEIPNGIYVKVTFNGNGGTLTGDTIIKVRSGKKFSSIKAPEAHKEGSTFKGWFDAAEGGQEIPPTKEINEDLNVFAQWTNAEPVELSFPAVEGVTYKGPTTVNIMPEQTFANVARPDVIHASGYEFDYWKAGNQKIDTETNFTYQKFVEDPTLRTITPVFKGPKVFSVKITNGDPICSNNELSVQCTAQLNVTVEGQQDVDKTVAWSSDNPAITVDANGKITAVGAVAGYVTITATSNADHTTKDSIKIKAVTPMAKYPDEIFVDHDSTTSVEYWKVNSGLYDDGTGPAISITKVGEPSSNEEITRSTFNLPIMLGDDVTTLGNGFLDGCAGFNSEITLDDNLKLIGDAFMASCSMFNQPLAIPNGLLHIGSDFMYGCSAFNNSLALGSESTKSSLMYIGESFMVDCHVFTNLVIYCDVGAFQAHTFVDTLTTNDSGRLVTVSGSGANEFKAKFPPITDSTSNIFREYAS